MLKERMTNMWIRSENRQCLVFCKAFWLTKTFIEGKPIYKLVGACDTNEDSGLILYECDEESKIIDTLDVISKYISSGKIDEILEL